MRRRWLRRLGKGALLLSAVLTALAWIATDHFRSFGGDPLGFSGERVRASKNFRDGEFQNTEVTTLMLKGAYRASAKMFLDPPALTAPNCPLPVVRAKAQPLPASGLRITWLGHSTTLIELDGARFLTDPNFSERASPTQWLGPQRFHPPPMALDDLPKLDAVLISHEHYDHLDMYSVRELAARGVKFHVPLGVGAHLHAWDVPTRQIIEHDWWEPSRISDRVRLISTPARHFNGRGVPFRTGTFWTSWVMQGDAHRVFFSGDTGASRTFDQVRDKLGPFDVAMLEIGQYHESWGEIHLGPVGALELSQQLRAKALFPIHWGTFKLAFHPWSEPAETLAVAAEKRGVRLLTPRLGEAIEPDGGQDGARWWRTLPPNSDNCP